MPAAMSIERRALLKAFGADLVITGAQRGFEESFDAEVTYASKFWTGECTANTLRVYYVFILLTS